MALSERLALLITANGSQAIAEFQKTGAAAQKSLTAAQTSSQALSANLVRVGAGMAALGGVALVGLYKAAQAAEAENLAIEKLNNSLANSPELAGASADAFLDQAAALQDVTTWADDATIAAQAMLGTFHLTQDEILGLTPLVQDLASKFDLDLNRASILVGKAMDGNVTTLQRMGVRIDEAAYATDRYGAVVTALRENAGGFAEQEGQTFNGQIEIMKNNLGDIAEGVGRGAIQAFNDLLGPVKSVSDAFTELSPGTQATVGKLATFGAVGLVAAGGLSMVAGAALRLREAFIVLQAANLGASGSALAAAGPWGALAAILVGIHTGVIDLTSALTPEELDTGAIDSMTAAMTEAGDATEGLVAHLSDSDEFDPSFFRALGVGAEDFAAALLSGSDAWAEFKEQALEGLPDGADLGVWSDALDQHRERALAAAEATERQANSTEGLAQSAEEAAAAFDQLDARISDYLDGLQSAEEANAANAEAAQAWEAALRANGHTYDINTEAGRNNIEMRNSWMDTIGGQIQATMDFAERTGRYQAAQQRANRVIQAGIGELRRMKDAGLLTQEQFNRLSDEIRRVPHRVPVDIDTNVQDAMVEVSGLQQSLWELERTYTIPISIVAPQYLPGQARGGSFSAGEFHMVGEEGPELRMATGSGQTFSAAETRQILSGGGGGGGLTINVYGDLDDRTLPRIEQAINRGVPTPNLDRKIRRLAGAR